MKKRTLLIRYEQYNEFPIGVMLRQTISTVKSKQQIKISETGRNHSSKLKYLKPDGIVAAY